MEPSDFINKCDGPRRMLKQAMNVGDTTPTKLYNKRLHWLDDAHATTGAAVAAAYDWTNRVSRLSDDEILNGLLTKIFRQVAVGDVRKG